MTADTHELLIRAMQEYCKFQDQFEYDNNLTAGVRAGKCLARAHQLIKLRKQQILNKRREIDKTRIRKPGRPKKIHS